MGNTSHSAILKFQWMNEVCTIVGWYSLTKHVYILKFYMIINFMNVESFFSSGGEIWKKTWIMLK